MKVFYLISIILGTPLAIALFVYGTYKNDITISALGVFVVGIIIMINKITRMTQDIK